MIETEMRAEAQIRLKAAELTAKYGAQVNIAEINAIMERDRENIRQTAKRSSSRTIYWQWQSSYIT